MIPLDRVIVSSTDVNRRPGEILDQAQKGPVLVTRGDEPLVIAQHSLVRGLVESDARSALMSDLSQYLVQRLAKRDAKDQGGPFGWLGEFDNEDVVEFVRELRTAYRTARSRPATWPLFDAVVHEWQESAIRPAEYVKELATADR